MKKAIVVLLLLISNFCYAQKVFIIRLPWSLNSFGLPPAWIKKDGEKFKKIKRGDVVIDKPEKIPAKYYYRFDRHKKYTLNDNKTHFVYALIRYRVLPFWRIKFKEISEERFRELYSEKEWLRKALARQGYDNVDDAINR